MQEFYIPVQSSSIHFLKTKLCVGCTNGFEIVDLDTLDTQGLLDPADASLDFVRKRENLKPLAIYRIENEFLLCYDGQYAWLRSKNVMSDGLFAEFAFYVNKTGWRSRKHFMVYWEGTPTGFGELIPSSDRMLSLLTTETSPALSLCPRIRTYLCRDPTR